MKHPKTKHRASRHTPHNASITPGHPIILPLSTNPPKQRSSNGPYAGITNDTQWFRHPKKDPTVAATDRVIRLPHHSTSTTAIWGRAGYNYQWNNLIAGVDPRISDADLTSPYGTLTPLNGFAYASFQTRLGMPLNHVMDFGTTARTLGSFSMPPVITPVH